MWQRIEQNVTNQAQGPLLFESRVVDNVQVSMLNRDITRATHCISKILFSQLFVFSGFFTCKSSDARGVIKSLCYFQIPKFFKFLKQVFVEQDVILGQNYSLSEVKFFTL